MGYSIGFDEKWKRDVGYGVPCICDHPGCNEKIDRGLDYVCGDEPFGGQYGCGLYFCEEHKDSRIRGGQFVNLCSRCRTGHKPANPKPDTQEWMLFKLTDDSWGEWRKENVNEVDRISLLMRKGKV